MKHAMILACLLVLGCGTTPPPLPPAPSPVPATPRDPYRPSQVAINFTLLDLHNAARAQAKLPPLTIDHHLYVSAAVQADCCAKTHTLTHAGCDGADVGVRISRTGYAWGYCEENAGEQPPWSPSSWPGPDFRTESWAMEGWLASPGHRANILSPQVTQMGVAYADAADGTRFWVVDFGRPR